MSSGDYEIIPFNPELTGEVVQLLSDLWGDNYESNLSYFQWKYIQNPFTDTALGIVALYKGNVVGFRGYFATKWIVSEETKKIIILCPGDTVVHPDHRRKRLSVIMGDKAKEDYSSTYPIFFNFSASKNSAPGYLRMGFVPIVDKQYLNSCNLIGLIKFIVADKGEKDLSSSPITFGNFNNIEVLDRPKPESMSAIISAYKDNIKTIRLLQDEAFFKWRFNNNKKKYVFYYYNNSKTIGYAAVRLSQNNRRGYIVDFAADSPLTLAKIVSFIKHNNHFNILSIYNYSLSENISDILKSLNFKSNNIASILAKKANGVWPLFIRPVKDKYAESDFFIQGLDIRELKNWSIKEICSDGS